MPTHKTQELVNNKMRDNVLGTIEEDLGVTYNTGPCKL